MPIKRLTPTAEIDRYITGRVEAIKKALVHNLIYVGESCINAARISASKGKDFTDQTGNLRSSIGYVVAVDGEIVQMSSFEVVKEGSEGARGGKEYAMQLVRDFPQGIVLIVVAGMNYASYVTAKGYDVLDSSELLADKLVPQMLQQLGFK